MQKLLFLCVCEYVGYLITSKRLAESELNLKQDYDLENSYFLSHTE